MEPRLGFRSCQECGHQAPPSKMLRAGLPAAQNPRHMTWASITTGRPMRLAVWGMLDLARRRCRMSTSLTRMNGWWAQDLRVHSSAGHAPSFSARMGVHHRGWRAVISVATPLRRWVPSSKASSRPRVATFHRCRGGSVFLIPLRAVAGGAEDDMVECDHRVLVGASGRATRSPSAKAPANNGIRYRLLG